MSDKLQKLKELLDPVVNKFSPAKASYVKALLSEIYADIAITEKRLESFQAKAHGFKDQTQFLDSFELLTCLFILISGKDLLIYNFRKDLIDWMTLHYSELKRTFEWKELLKVYRNLEMYWLTKEKFPESYAELKEFIKLNNIE